MIARLNVGGPSIQVIDLTARLRARGYETVLLRGAEGPHEGTMDYLADELGVQTVRVPGLRRGVGLHDLVALRAVLGWLRTFRPDVLHTHTAKAGAIGRLAVAIAPWWRPRVVVHTFHGHVLKGEFSPILSRLIALIERLLATQATVLIAVSQEVADDLVQFGVAKRDKIKVVPLGFDLSPFAAEEDERQRLRLMLRDELGIAEGEVVVTLAARVARIKRVDRFLRACVALHDLPDVRFMIVGDGLQRTLLEDSEEAKVLGTRLIWTGFRRDMPTVFCASDIAVLTSDNEGTPVSLIEAGAAGLPVVSTHVGGVASVVEDGETGLLVPPAEDAALAWAVRRLVVDRELRERLGQAGRGRVLELFSVERLVADIDQLYRNAIRAAGASRR